MSEVVLSTLTCSSCGNAVVAGDSFCETCGAEISPSATAAVAATAPSGERSMAETQPTPVVRLCRECGALIAADGYCGECGAKGRTARDHWEEQPVPWAAAVCDRGLVHARNEDALGLVALPEVGSFAALIVCDGVSTSSNSDVASLGAAHAARDVLGTITADPFAPVSARIMRISAAIEAAGAAAQMAASATPITEGGAQSSPPACTFVTAVVERKLIVAGWVGDSRAYWIPSTGPAELLTTDHSAAAEMIEAGVSRSVAESSAQAHAITRWLGSDSPNPVPQCATTTVNCAGWLLVCSDGLWNYCSTATDMAALVATYTASANDPLPIAAALVQWAIGQGGHDNIAVVLAYIPAS